MFKDFKEVITKNTQETVKLGKEFAQNVKGGDIICLKGGLGAGKTTFTQGFLKTLGAEGALTSPTFIVMKKYSLKKNSYKVKNIYHIDTYRVESEDILDLGWKELIGNKENIIIIEWPEKIKNIIPFRAVWLNFELIDKDRRRVSFISR
ncbi:MAG: tRNA (adenosine(37)-N6)-threonylcarbamoyltransferase complex ATPase subunit type 1 TsaE [Parcubacteria group bacterium]|jgi:tRNA threonylcarbamoyladenosine biosynthesis protein TsaE